MGATHPIFAESLSMVNGFSHPATLHAAADPPPLYGRAVAAQDSRLDAERRRSKEDGPP